MDLGVGPPFSASGFKVRDATPTTRREPADERLFCSRVPRKGAPSYGAGCRRRSGTELRRRRARQGRMLRFPLPQGRPRGVARAPKRCATSGDMQSQKCSFCVGISNNYANNYAFPLEIVTFAPASPEAGGSACGSLYRIPNKGVSRSCWRSCC